MDNNINKILHNLNWTQEVLAAMVEVKREYINRIINNKITPTIPLGMKIARALDKTVEEVFNLE